MLVYVYLSWNPHSYPASHILQGYAECCAGFPHFLKHNFQSVSNRMIFLKYWFFFFFLSPISPAEMLGSEFPATGERWGSSKRRHGWRDASWQWVLRTPGTTRSLQLAPWLSWWLREKESACNAGDPGSIPGLGRSPGYRIGYPLQYSCLENPMDRGDWQAAALQKSDWTERLTLSLSLLVERSRSSAHQHLLAPPHSHSSILLKMKEGRRSVKREDRAETEMGIWEGPSIPLLRLELWWCVSE